MKQLHFVNQRPILGPYPDECEQIYFGMGCFWGAERLFWQIEGVWVTSVGYGGGQTKSPNYHQVCTGNTGHAELVHVVFNPDILSLNNLLETFFENHDPTQGNRQGNDIGSQYRSLIGVVNAKQKQIAQNKKQQYDKAYTQAGKAALTTEIIILDNYTLAEDYHQQYLAKNPSGYCGLKGTGIKAT